MKNHLFKHISWIFLSFVFSLSLVAQDDNAVGSWNVVYANWKPNQQLFWYNEIQYRNHNLLTSFDISSYRSGIGFNNKKGSAYGLLGVLTAIHENDQEQLVNRERRIYQEAGIDASLLTKSVFETRLRIEQRFFNHHKFSMRYRLQLKVEHELPLTTKYMIYPFISSEVFIQNKEGLFNQNRTAVGLSFSHNNLDASLAKQWQFLPNRKTKQQLVLKLGFNF